MALRPATEFGEASSDDLSSEWESSSESECSPVGNTFTGFPGTGARSDGSLIGFIDKSGEGQDSGSGEQAATPIMRTTSKRVRCELMTLIMVELLAFDRQNAFFTSFLKVVKT